MEEEVKDVILVGKSNDFTLVALLSIAKTSIQSGRPISNNILAEPVFFERYFKKWVQEGFDELELTDTLEQGPPQE